MAELYLSVGDSPTSDFIDLLDRGAHYLLHGRIVAPPPPPDAGERTLGLTLRVCGADNDAVLANYRAIEAKLAQARAASAGPVPAGAVGVVLGWRWTGASSRVYFDVLDGSLEPVEVWPDWMRVQLTLVCLPLARGDEIALDESDPIANASGTLWIGGVPGDADPITRLVLTDQSSGGAVINGWVIGRRAFAGMGQDDFQPVLDAAAVAPGAAQGETDAVGGAVVRYVPTAAWTTIAAFEQPASGDLHHGRFVPWLRVRDRTETIGPPQGVSAQGLDEVRIVQATSADSGAGTASSGQISWPQPTTPGNTLILDVRTEGASVTTPSGWTLHEQVGGAGGSPRYVRFVQYNAAQNSGTVNLAFGSATQWSAWMAEWRGLAASPFDVHAETSQDGGATSLGTGTTGTTSQAHALALAGWSVTVDQPVQSPNTELFDNNRGHAVAARILVATGTQAMTATVATSTAHAALIDVFRAAQASPPDIVTSGQAMLRYCVSALSAGGVESAPSAIVTAQLDAYEVGYLTWEPPAYGTVAGYRVYWSRDGGDWRWFNTGSTATSYTHRTEGGAPLGDPPAAGPELAKLRLLAGLASAQLLHLPQGYSQPERGNGEWEFVPLDQVTLPPQPAVDGGAPLRWTLRLQARSDGRGPGPLDVDALWLYPADEPATVVTHPSGDLGTPRRHVVATRRDGRALAHLRAISDDSEQGPLLVRAPFTLGANENLLVIHALTAGFASRLDGVAFSVRAYLTPRYRLVRGTV
jgi:hypothetical protein